ncbi:MAG: nitrite oxidoreductase, gamma subunit [Candidatus Nitrohelix vancouverensis]|uniref:Nitrite oxidoreductase, gamma subunit n=1 Tax=Candidatus Nitrohelix vancouverensis TaxID=2705534 RepID=A0A7T0C574_9BACT|nr:MAG: nitrite oxidoreductase, gamma subunit [Candidatus Nitrohelix vancouverensis]
MAFVASCALGLGVASTSDAAVIQALKISGDIPGNPGDVFWSTYGPTRGKGSLIEMDPQMITNPMWPNPAVKWVNVKAASNGKEVAVRLEWTDGTRNDIMVRSQQYKDQAAIMFPVDQTGEEPPFTMGGDGERVNIWQWKATWDKEGAGRAGNDGMQDLEDQYLDMAMGSGSYYMYEPDGKLSGLDTSHETGTKDASRANRGAGDISKRGTHVDFGMGKNEGVFNPGRATGNILSDASQRVSAVEDMNAEGFSTLTTQAHQDVQGKGNWENNRWAVVFTRSLTTSDANDTQFGGSKTPMAIAIWNGQNKERNGQKAVTQWHELRY